MAASEEMSTAPALERATELAGQKVGRSTIDRVRKGETTVNLDYIEVFARVFRKKPWELLTPDLGSGAPGPEVTLEAAVDLLALTLENFPEGVRLMIADRLETLAKAPDSTKTKRALLEALQGEGSGERPLRTGTHDH